MTAAVSRTFRPPEDPVYGTLYMPADPEVRVGVVLIGGSSAVEPFFLGEALAREGIAALSVAYFHRTGLPDTLAEIPLEYFLSAVRLLRDALPPDTLVAVSGTSRGSEAAMLTAIHAGGLVGAVVANVPGNVVLGSWPPGRPAWLLQGRPLPTADDFGPECDRPEAIIPVERVPGPMLLIAAGTDEIWPSLPMARAISERLKRHGDRYGHRVLEYPGTKHSLGYLVPQIPAGLLPEDTEDDAQTQAARADALGHVIRFLRDLPDRLRPDHRA
ncbi:MAG: acyl-CoA thioester hydrolase/BAAT C-terminal domain-containing protein [Clostridia bacterium]